MAMGVATSRRDPSATPFEDSGRATLAGVITALTGTMLNSRENSRSSNHRVRRAHPAGFRPRCRARERLRRRAICSSFGSRTPDSQAARRQPPAVRIAGRTAHNGIRKAAWNVFRSFTNDRLGGEESRSPRSLAARHRDWPAWRQFARRASKWCSLRRMRERLSI